jgi:hypothetical protein
MNGFTGLLEGLSVLVVAFGGLLWVDWRARATSRAEPRRERHPGLPPRETPDAVPPEIVRPAERESEIRDHLYGESAKVSAETGVLSTRRVPRSTRRVPASTRREDRSD